jgi:hypothetical protein
MYYYTSLGNTYYSYWVQPCNVSNESCNATNGGGAWSGREVDIVGTIDPGTMTPTLRAVGDYIEEVDTTSNKLNVHYCDASAYVVSNSGCQGGLTSCNTRAALGGTAEIAGADTFCRSGANWKTVQLTASGSMIYLGGAIGTVVGMPHPTYGFMAASQYTNFNATTPGAGFWSCPYTYPQPGYVAEQQTDCSNANNWTGITFTHQYAQSIDMTASTANYQPFHNVSGENEGVFISYYASDDNSWHVASCRHSPTDPYYNPGYPWVCNKSSGWASAIVAGSTGQPLSSTIRVVNGDLMALFLDQQRITLANCSGAADCARASSWQVYAISNAISTDYLGGAGLLTADPANLFYLGYPNFVGSTRSINFVTQGVFRGPQ